MRMQDVQQCFVNNIICEIVLDARAHKFDFLKNKSRKS